MSKPYLVDTRHLPFSPTLLTLLHSPSLPISTSRPASQQLLPTQQQLQLTNLSDDDESLLQPNPLSLSHLQLKRLKPTKKPLPSKSSLLLQIQSLKKQLTTLTQKHESTKSSLSSTHLLLKQKQVDLKHYQASSNDLSQNIKILEKRKSILQLELSKVFNQLETSRQDVEKYEREITHLLGVQKGKDSELIELMHRHSEEVKELKNSHKAVVQEYEEKQEETKKLLKKLNGINLQKEYKMKEELEQVRRSYEKADEMSVEQGRSIQRLEEEVRGLREEMRGREKKYEVELVGVRGEEERRGREMVERKEGEWRRNEEQMRREITQKEKEIAGLHQRLRNEQERWREITDNKQKQLKSTSDELRSKQKQLSKLLNQHQKQLTQLSTELSLKQQLIQQLQISTHQLSSKNQALQTSLTSLYHQTSSLQTKLLSLTNSNSSLTSQTLTLKQHLRTTKQQLLSTQNALSLKSSDLHRSESQLTKVSLTLEKLTDELLHFDKQNKELLAENQRLQEIDAEHKGSNVQLRQLVLEKEMGYEGLKEKYGKLKGFIENYKVEGERTRESMERKWGELKVVYEKQLEELEEKLQEKERGERGLRLRMEELERENRIYEFENSVVPGIGNTNIYHKM